MGTPDYGLEGCKPGEYRSVFVARKSDPRIDPRAYRSDILAVNDPLSQSGWAAPAQWAKDHGFEFERVRLSGGHQASARDVAEGRAAIAAIDAQTWLFIERYDDFASALHVIGTTPATPGLPFITAQMDSVDDLFHACDAAIRALSSQDKKLLSIKGIIRFVPEAYLAVPTPSAPPVDATAS